MLSSLVECIFDVYIFDVYLAQKCIILIIYHEKSSIEFGKLGSIELEPKLGPSSKINTLSVIPEPNFGFDELQDLGGRGAGVELDGVELAVHEVESRVNRTPIDRTQDLLH
jgi:hypothetical protein